MYFTVIEVFPSMFQVSLFTVLTVPLVLYMLYSILTCVVIIRPKTDQNNLLCMNVQGYVIQWFKVTCKRFDYTI